MPLPNQRSGNYQYGEPMGDPWEQLQDVLMWTHNRRVIEEFRDLTPGDQMWTADLRTPRERLRWATTIKDADTAGMVMLRMWLFYVIMGKAADFQAPVYGVPVTGFQEARKFHPQIQLEFAEDLQDVAEGYSPISGVISFRLMNETTETFTRAEAERLATRVKTAFGAGAGFVWRKGKLLCSYTDREKGYKLQLLCRTETEARRIVNKVLEVQQHSPDWSRLNISKNEAESSRYPIIPEQIRVLGSTRRAPRQRPIADVRFRRALLHLWGQPYPLVLVDLTGYHRNTIAS